MLLDVAQICNNSDCDDRYEIACEGTVTALFFLGPALAYYPMPLLFTSLFPNKSFLLKKKQQIRKDSC
jgi:hypothetical protein